MAALSQPGSEQRNPLQPQPPSAVDLSYTRQSGGVWPKRVPGCLDLPPDAQSNCSETIPTRVGPRRKEAPLLPAPNAHTTHDFSIWHFMATVCWVALLCAASGKPSRCRLVLGCAHSHRADGTESRRDSKRPQQNVS